MQTYEQFLESQLERIAEVLEDYFTIDSIYNDIQRILEEEYNEDS